MYRKYTHTLPYPHTHSKHFSSVHTFGGIGEGKMDELEIIVDQPKRGKKRGVHERDDDIFGWVAIEGEAEIAPSKKAKKQAVWQDEEDEGMGGTDLVEQQDRLRQQWNERQVQPEWAVKKSSEEEEDSDRVDAESGFGSVIGRALTWESKSQFIRKVDANRGHKQGKAITSVEYHPNGEMMLLMGEDKVMRLMNIVEDKRQCVKEIAFPKVPLTTASFTDRGQKVYLGGPTAVSYYYDIQQDELVRLPRFVRDREERYERFVVSPNNQYVAVCSHAGSILLIHNQSHKLIAELKSSYPVKCLAFSPDADVLWAGGEHGSIYGWDLRVRRCGRSFMDESGLQLHAIAMSPSGKQLAIGNQAGVLSMYDMDSILTATPTPSHTLLNLRSPVTSIAYSPHHPFLTYASSYVRNAIRCVSIPAGRVHADWPGLKGVGGCPTDIAIHPFDPTLAVGLANGRVPLWSITTQST